MLVKDAQKAIRMRLDFYPTLVLWQKLLCDWLESPGDICQPPSKRRQAGPVNYLSPGQFLNFPNPCPLKSLILSLPTQL